MHVSKRIDLELLDDELTTAGVPHRFLTLSGTDTDGELLTYDDTGALIDLPPEAAPVVDAHVAPPRVLEYAGASRVSALLRTTDATAHEIYRLPTQQKRLYTANLTILGVDAGNFVSKSLEGRFTWKRTTTASPVMVGIVVVSDIHDSAAASWAPNAAPSGSDIVFTVQGAAGRTIDWLLAGDVAEYAPAGLAAE